MHMPSIALHVFKIYFEHVKLAAALSDLFHLLVLQPRYFFTACGKSFPMLAIQFSHYYMWYPPVDHGSQAKIGISRFFWNNNDFWHRFLCDDKVFDKYASSVSCRTICSF